METNTENLTVTVYGAGYVGLVTATCLTKLGYSVLCVDVNSTKVEQLNAGQVPIYEPGLEELIVEAKNADKLKFSTDIKVGAEFGFYQFIAVGTPPTADGSADLQYVYAVAKQIAQYRNHYAVVINKSTVPVGTADEVYKIIAETARELNKPFDFAVVSNPEFLKEGSAVKDFMQPDRIIVGANNDDALTAMQRLYQPFIAQGFKLIAMDIRSAELTKYAANALLATKISFMNEISQIAERLGADVELIKQGIGSDPRIGPYFINPGCGYGGSCFPKDVRALCATAQTANYEPILLPAVEQVNLKQKQVLFKKIQKYFDGQLRGRVLAVWGLAFKPNTNDMRDAASIDLVTALLAAGVRVQAYDPVALAEAMHVFGNESGLSFCTTAQDALEGADALAIVTEWDEFRDFTPEQIRARLVTPVVFDGRNVYEPALMQKLGFTYFAIGRGDKI